MRTTLTLEDDVSALLERMRRDRKGSLKGLVNDALRRGLKDMLVPPQRNKPYQTRTASLGRCLLGHLDDTAEALAVAEGEDPGDPR